MTRSIIWIEMTPPAARAKRKKRATHYLRPYAAVMAFPIFDFRFGWNFFVLMGDHAGSSLRAGGGGDGDQADDGSVGGCGFDLAAADEIGREVEDDFARGDLG